MATPLSPDRIVAALRARGLRVVEYKSWRTHNRNHQGLWGPVHGVMLHHTVTRDDKSSVELCYNGHANLPGPLCLGVITTDGTVYLVGNGRANHAGLGDDDVLKAVINETSPLPADNETNTDGNRYFYGFECVNMGDNIDDWPAVQVDAMVKASAALCSEHGWSQRSVIGHLEWQPGKVDPRGPGFPGMNAMRDRIGANLRAGVDTGKTTPVPAPVPVPEGGDDMPTAAEIAKAVLDADRVPAARPPHHNPDYSTNKTWSLKYAIQTDVEAGRKTLGIVEDLQDKVDALTEKVDALTASLRDGA